MVLNYGTDIFQDDQIKIQLINILMVFQKHASLWLQDKRYFTVLQTEDFALLVRGVQTQFIRVEKFRKWLLFMLFDMG